MNANRFTPFPTPSGLPAGRQWLILAALAVAGVVLFVGAPLAGRLLAAPAAPVQQAPPPGTFQATDEQWATLGLQQVGRVTVQEGIETDGKIAADDDLTTQVFSPYSGRVTQIFVKAGDTVRAGQPLFAVQAAEIAQGRSDLAAAAAQAALAEANEARQHAMYDTAGGSLKDWRQSQADLAAARAALAAAQGKLKALGRTDAEIAAMAKAAPGSSGAAATVNAPIAGVVTQRLIGVGQNVGSLAAGGSGAAMVVSDLRKVWLVADVREADSGGVHKGLPLRVQVLALPGRTFTANVDYVAPAIDPATRRLTVRAALDNPDGLIKPEMFATFSVTVGPAQSGVAVPEAAVIFEGDEARVWVARPQGQSLELRRIQAGQTQDGQVQVLSGLSPGEWVVTSGSLFIDRASRPD